MNGSLLAPPPNRAVELNNPIPIGLCILLALALPPSAAIADDDRDLFYTLDDSFQFPPMTSEGDAYVYETTVNGHSIQPTDETTAFAQTIRVGEKNKTVESVSQVLSTSVGVQVRNLGGLGSYGSASIRGSTAAQVPVYLDGVLLNSGGFSSVNLGDLSLDILESIEVYRGNTPISLGARSIGGAISLNSAELDDPATQVAMSYGSWGTARAMALRGDKIAGTNVLTIFSAQGSQGNFEYLNTNGTPLNENDDRIQERQNNQHVSYTGLLKLDRRFGSWRWGLMDDLIVKRQGVAGIDSVPTRHSELRTFRNAGSLMASRRFGKIANLELGGSHLFLSEDFNDAQNEIGVGHQRTVSRSDTVAAHGTLGLKPSARQQIHLRIDGNLERFSGRNLLEDETADPKTRIVTGLGLEYGVFLFEALDLVPALRLEWHHSRFPGGDAPSSVKTMESRTSDDLFFSPSMGVRWEATAGLTLRANCGRYVRPPDLLELFGDLGSVVGNPRLDPEVGVNGDIGLTYLLENQGVLSLLRFDAAWFGSWVRDLIAYVQNSQNTIKPENLDRARILGAETGLRVLLGDLFGVQANYTYLNGINLSNKPYHHGRRLPGRPEHEFYGKMEVSRTRESWGGALWVDVDYAGQNYLDQANLKEDAMARLLFGAGLRLEAPRRGLTLTIDVKNLFDKITIPGRDGRLRPLRDYEAFPLPGRTVFATVHWNI